MAEYGDSVETSASAEQVWSVWSDVSTWSEWNPNVSSMELSGAFAANSAVVMNTRAGQHHQMRIVELDPGRSFVLQTKVVPGTTFFFHCRVESAAGKTRISQTVEVKGPLGPILGPMIGPQVSKDFGTLLRNLAGRAEVA